MSNDLRQVILDTVSDLAADFMYYDRKEDEELPRGAIEDAVTSGVVSVDEIVNHFRAELTRKLS